MNHPVQPPGQARYLNGKPVSVIATDYGGYTVACPLPQYRVGAVR